MKRISTILVLLLAIGLVAVSAMPPAVHAVQNSDSQSGIAGTGVANTSTAGTSGTTTGGDGEQGDPGGAGDGLGADPELRPGAASLDSGVDVVVDLVKQLLLLLQVVG